MCSLKVNNTRRMEFTEARHIAKMTRAETLDYLDISNSTLTRYERGNKVPKSVIECLLMIGGRLPNFEHTKRKDSFINWYFANGYLYTNNGERFTSGDINAIKKNLELIQEIRKENKKLNVNNTKQRSNVVPFPTMNNRVKSALVMQEEKQKTKSRNSSRKDQGGKDNKRDLIA
jgi:transcriptional regulator with XRE-family HTH domain